MNLITRNTDYAIRIIKFLFNTKYNFSSTKYIKNKLKIPKYFLRKIIRLLSKNKIINSYKGKNGGVEIVRNPDDINLLDIFETFQGKFKMNECKFKSKPCPEQKTCKLKKQINEIENYVLNKFENLKIKDIL